VASTNIRFQAPIENHLISREEKLNPLAQEAAQITNSKAQLVPRRPFPQYTSCPSWICDGCIVYQFWRNVLHTPIAGHSIRCRRTLTRCPDCAVSCVAQGRWIKHTSCRNTGTGVFRPHALRDAIVSCISCRISYCSARIRSHAWSSDACKFPWAALAGALPLLGLRTLQAPQSLMVEVAREPAETEAQL
jgi:hypothetical protein